MENTTITRIENVSRTYGKGHAQVNALKNCSLTLKKGEFVAIIGKSGSGKSTLLRILGTIDRPSKVEGVDTLVEIDGQNVLTMKDKQLSQFRRKRIGFVFQEYNLFPEFTAYENIIMPLHISGEKADDKKVEELLKTLGIEHCKNKFPHEMSGGEQQRVGIARALITEPAIILADEPTGNLDVENALEVAKILKKSAQLYNQTIIIVTHDMQMAEFADRILHIEDGVVTVQGE
ncbi:MAG: ABC transporter ATP-binding protein [Lachnospiraceae bacterium]|nr:ABC transporter ATP-binding protein [Lachnospiraceae bacterium]